MINSAQNAFTKKALFEIFQNWWFWVVYMPVSPFWPFIHFIHFKNLNRHYKQQCAHLFIHCVKCKCCNTPFLLKIWFIFFLTFERKIIEKNAIQHLTIIICNIIYTIQTQYLAAVFLEFMKCFPAIENNSNKKKNRQCIVHTYLISSVYVYFDTLPNVRSLN